MILNINKVSVNAPRSGTKLLDNISCSVNEGEILSIIGPNGAGKSTLLSAIAQDIVYQGDIEITGLSQDPKQRARQVAVLPQLSLLNFPFRVSEVVNLSRIPHQSGRERDQQIIQQALELMDIGFLAKRLYTELSGGEKQRVQLARVLAQIWDRQDSPNGTRLLLLDEPTTALDLGHQQDLMKAIRQFAKQGVAIVMVLHDVNLAAQYADHLLALQCSRTVAYGKVNDVVTSENIQQLFGITAQIMSHPQSKTPIVVGL